MKLSYQWLQTYFEKELPPPDKLAELLTFHAYEVEGMEEVDDAYSGQKDYIFNIDVLPNRASDSLCHRGVAREIAALTENEVVAEDAQHVEQSGRGSIAVDIQEPALCRRYIAQVVEGVSVGAPPPWLAARLESIGQKSINNIVDITNFVMFDLGQPLHAFDLDKIKGGTISIRKATEGEQMTTLDGEEITFEGGELIIADNHPSEGGPLALAGVKGGTRAAIDQGTTRIVFEAALFDSKIVRRAARKYGLLTESAKRFENGISIHLAPEATTRATRLVKSSEEHESARVAEPMDMYERLPARHVMGVSNKEVNRLLGTQLLDDEIVAILKRLRFEPRIVEDPYARVVEEALEYMGTPYKYGASITYDAPRAFDCSSFVAYLFNNAGVSMPRQVVDQFVYGEEVKEGEEQPGDIVFARNATPQTRSFTLVENREEVTHEGAKDESEDFLPGTKVEGGVSHNGILLGDGKVVHAHPEQGVVVEGLGASEKFKNVVGIRRISTRGEKRIVVTVPHDRLDICTPQDKISTPEPLIEEIGRVYGYRNIDAQLPDGAEGNVAKPNKAFYYTNVIRNALAGAGFSEVQTYSFREDGKVEVANPLASDKAFVRASLRAGIVEALEKNVRYAPLLGSDDICIFEIGTVFEGIENEHTALAIGVRTAHQTKAAKRQAREEELIKQGRQAVEEALGTALPGQAKDGVLEINFSEIIETLPELSETYDNIFPESSNTTYRPISPYPFVLRDVAAWAPKEVGSSEVLKLIALNAGELLARPPKLFDEFEKDGRVSYAFNLVFQSPDRTLTDEEANEIMERIYKKVEEKGWEPR